VKDRGLREQYLGSRASLALARGGFRIIARARVRAVRVGRLSLARAARCWVVAVSARARVELGWAAWIGPRGQFGVFHFSKEIKLAYDFM
jgi:hypothetical protein